MAEGINAKATKLRLSHISAVPILDPTDLFKRVQSLVNVCQVMLQLSHSYQLDSMDWVGIRVILSLGGEREREWLKRQACEYKWLLYISRYLPISVSKCYCYSSNAVTLPLVLQFIPNQRFVLSLQRSC